MFPDRRCHEAKARVSHTRRVSCALVDVTWFMKASFVDAARTSDWTELGVTAGVDQGELFERAFRHAAIGMALVDLEGRWLKVNDALCRTFGYAREELLALDFQTITHPADRDTDPGLVKQLLDGVIETYELEKRYLRQGGRVVWGVLSVTLARSADGEPRFFIAQIQDNTPRKLAESSMAEFFAASPDLLAIA